MTLITKEMFFHGCSSERKCNDYFNISIKCDYYILYFYAYSFFYTLCLWSFKLVHELEV